MVSDRAAFSFAPRTRNMDAATKPARMDVDAANVPASLKALDRWIGWSWRWRNEKWDKPPLRIDDGKAAKSNDPKTWCSFDDAIKAHIEGRFDGIGITFGDCGGKNLAGVDLDDVIQDGKLAPWAGWVIARLDTYCEISPSGSGVKLFCWGHLPPGKRNDSDGRGVEMYDSGRYFTVTGRRYPDTPAEVMDRRSILGHLHSELLGENLFLGPKNPQKTDREWALEYLKFVSPTLAENYGDWVGVGMALHNVSEELLPDWDEWSKSSSKYKDGECAKKWRSFGQRSGGLTIKSLGHWAKQNGWQSQKQNGRLSPSTNGHATEHVNGKSATPTVTEGARQAGIADSAPVNPLGWLAYWGIDVDKVIKIGDKKGVYDLALKGGSTIQLGCVSDVLSPRLVQSAIADGTRITIPELKRADWRCIGAELIRIAEHQDVDADPQAELRDWIHDFASTQARGEAADDLAIINGVNNGGISRTETGIVYIGLTKFLNAISGMSPAKITRNELIQRLYREGFKKSRQVIRDGDKLKQARTWESQKGYYEKTQV